MFFTVRKNIRAFCNISELCFCVGLRFEILPAHGKAGGTVFLFNAGFPCDGAFNSVARAPNVHVGSKTEGGNMLDGLVGRTVFANTDGIVGKHPDTADF